jgi:hypothetical protein
MNLSIEYSRQLRARLMSTLESMLVEALSEHERDESLDSVAELIGEVVELIAICKRYAIADRERRYEMEIYISGEGVEWQTTLVEVQPQHLTVTY